MIIKILIQAVVMCFIGWLLCDIEPYKNYYWYSGIWHGLFLPVNFIRSLIFDDVLYQAARHTAAYSVFYWIFGILSLLSFIFGNGRKE